MHPILYQTNPKGSHGDCLRTVFAMLLGKQQKEVEDIPDFGGDNSKSYEKELRSYLARNSFHYQEMPFSTLLTGNISNHISEGSCVVIGRYRGIPHAMTGYLTHTVTRRGRCSYSLFIYNCPVRGELNMFYYDYEEELLGVGFLTKKL